MDHLLKKRHVSRRLNDLSSIAVNDGQYRTRDAARDATDIEAEVFPGIVNNIVVAAAPRACRCSAALRLWRRCDCIAATTTLASPPAAAGLRLGRQRRNLTVWRINDERCLLARTSR